MALATALLGGAALLAGSARRSARLAARITWAPPGGRSGTAALAYRVQGSRLPATVLLHGVFASGRYWGAAYDTLAEESALLVPDLAGFGRSVEVADGFGPEVHADLVARTIAEVGLAGQPVVMGAHSLGCLVAIQLARRHPDLVAGIVAFSPPLYPDEAAARRCLSRASPLVGLFVASPSLSEAICNWMCEHQNVAGRLGRMLRPDLPAPLAEDRFKHTYRSYSQTLAKVVVAAGAAGWIEDVEVPIRLVAGTHDDLIDRAFLEDLSQRHPHVSLSWWPQAQHELPLTHPAACVAEIQHVRASLLDGR
ncbi:MAG: alpha/beta hydrolase [Actinobacteria bacterium]|nr:alpha/beta hydrolase [Actinomycetota bacterium]